MGSFITNQNGRFLSEIIKNILPKTESAAFLVGYFYFSGFAEIYQGLKDKHLRVLVGLQIEQDMINRIREVDCHTREKQTRGELKATYYDSLVDLFNETDYFDSEKRQEALNQIISNNLDLKSYEIESFGIPCLNDTTSKKLKKVYAEYLTDIEKNANIRTTTEKSKYNVSEFKEYKIGKSKYLIDQIDDIICPLYGLTKKETEFIKNYEIEFRRTDE